jgi:predicted transcriptional regulator
MSPDVPQDPTAGELDCLAVLWEAQETMGDRPCAMRLSEIHEGVCKRRESYGETAPALTTVSTYLRSALAKQLVHEVRRAEDGTVMPLVGIRTRGALSASRSPQTAYQPRVNPSEVFKPTFVAIIHSYPPGKRIQSLIDFAEAAELPQKTVKEIQKLVTDKKPK